jgi:ComF family protein
MTVRRFRYSFYKKMWAALDVIYPPRCSGCGELSSHWCDNCESLTNVIPPTACIKCGRVLTHSGICNVCLTHPPSYLGLRSWAVYKDPIRKAIHRLKYKKDISLGAVFSSYLISLLEAQYWNINAVVPVPLSIARQRERGYNQSALLAKPLALAKGLSYQPGLLKRTKETKSQVSLSLEERIKNVEGAFEANKECVRGKNILLIDDVTTSGATVDACSIALLQAGATCVYGLTLARTL